MATRGVAPKPWSELAPEVTGLVSILSRKVSPVPSAPVTGDRSTRQEDRKAQELAFTLANAVAYLRALEAHGMSLEEARRLIFFRLAADQDQFVTIAKFRAIRKLWARVGRGVRA